MYGKRLKIAICIDFFADSIAGAEVNSLEIARGLRNKGHKIEIISSRSIFSKPKPPDDSFKVRYAIGMYKVREISRNIRSTLLSDIFYKFPGWVFRKTVLKHVKRDYDLIYTYSFDILRCIVENSITTPVVFEVHNPVMAKYTSVLKKAMYIIAGSSDVAEKMLSQYNLSSTHISPGINLASFESLRSFKKLSIRHKLRLSVHDKIVVFVGRLIPFKNCGTLIKAFVEVRKLIPESKLIIIGQGILFRELKKLAESLDFKKNIKFLGLLPRELTLSYIRASDLVVVPSFYESFSRVAQEALALGTPLIISSGLVEFRKIFPEIEFFDPNFFGEISRKIIEQLNKKQISEMNISRLDQFSIDSVIPKYEKVFYKVISKHE